MNEKRVQSGRYFMMGNVACAEGAIAAGCEFAAGYPITPATEIANTLAERLPKVGGAFFQMEDEISSIAAVIGASWAGKKAMTAAPRRLIMEKPVPATRVAVVPTCPTARQKVRERRLMRASLRRWR